MKKVTLKENIEMIKKISSKMPKTINEAISFEHEDLDMEPNDELDANDDIDVHSDEPTQFDDNAGAGDMSEKARKLIDDIRKKSLRAMAELAETPQSPEYESLKRIWQLCDKAVNEKEEQREIMNKQNGLN